MSKLEELKAARVAAANAAYDAARVAAANAAYDAARDASAAKIASVTADAAYSAACDDYEAELKKLKEENSND